MNNKYIVDLAEVQLSDLELVGGKNASLGEMIQNLGKLGVNIPGGFARNYSNHLQLIKKAAASLCGVTSLLCSVGCKMGMCIL